MFDTIFLIKLLLSFLTGGAFVTLTLYVAEKHGPRIGGMVAGLPSTTAAGLFFIGFVESVEDASTASTIVPAAVGGSLIFVLCYVMLCGRLGSLNALLVSTIAWFAIALPLAALKVEDIYVSTLFFLPVWLVTMFYMSKQKGETKQTVIKQSRQEIILRAVFAGTVISSSVLISSMAGPLWGGALAAFPAMFLTTFLILGKNYGCRYGTAFARTTPLGLFAVIPYVWGVHYLYPVYGLIAGTLLSYILAFIGAGLVYVISLRKKI